MEAAGLDVERVEQHRDEFFLATKTGERTADAARAELERSLERLGVERELRRAGVGAGDLVRIGGEELEWGDEPWE
mgnify:CR=1 FL=1